MSAQTSPVALADAVDPNAFGGKAAHLAVAARAGLPVPPGVAAPWLLVDAVTGGESDAVSGLAAAASALGSFLAVRSSAVDEDSDAASFAGQHASLLNVPGAGLVDAVRAVARSARGDAALAYRRRLGLAEETARMGVVIQEMVDASVAGVLFRPHPVTGADEIVIEATWGLGTTVVDGLVTPDLFRLDVEGEVLEQRSGLKELEMGATVGGGTATRPADPARARERSLDDGQLAELHRLVTRCKAVFGGSQDLEWAFAGGVLWLLQRRAVTRGGPR